MTDDPLEQISKQHRYQAEESYSEEDDDSRKTAINQYLEKNDAFHDNLLRVYDDATRNGDPVSTVKLYKRTVELNGILVNILKDSEEEEELADKLEQEMEEMIQTVPPDNLERGLAKSERLNFPSSEIMSVVENHGTKLRQYCFWLLSGTEITSDSSTI